MKKLTIEDAKRAFLKSNYILLDSIFWEGIFQKLDECKVSYITIGLEYFGHKELCPLLIDLNQVKNKELLWDSFGESYHLNATSAFDYMAIFQNLITTDAGIEDFKEFIKDLMIIKIGKSKKIFRFYDSRVMMYMQYLINSNSNEFKGLYKKINRVKLDSWIINVSSNYYSILEDLNLVDLKNSYDIDFFYNITHEIREEFYLDKNSDLISLINKKVEC